jgi:site-specific DNA-methyltransferase (adenine-specific)
MTDETREVSIRDLQQDRRNANRGTERGTEMLQQSLARHGAGRSIVVDKHGQIIAGNHVAAAAAQAGISDVLMVPTDGHTLVAVQRMDLDLDEDPSARALAFADNRTGQVDIDLDPDAINAALADGVNIGSYWHAEEIAAMAAADAKAAKKAAKKAAGAGEEPPDSSQVTTRARAGDIWQLGPHRLAVGNSTNPALVTRLFGETRARAVWTDPPYGVGYQDNESVESLKARNRRTDGKVVLNDSLTEDQVRAITRDALTLAAAFSHPGAAVYVACPAGTLLPYFIEAVEAAGYRYTQALAWVKDVFVFGRSDYHYRHETVLYGAKPDGPRLFTAARTRETVFEVDRPKKSKEHPTMKPIALVLQMVENSSQPGEIIYDPFSGSGSTLIACERSDRACYAVELSEQYADVILARWELESGEQAEIADRPQG